MKEINKIQNVRFLIVLSPKILINFILVTGVSITDFFLSSNFVFFIDFTQARLWVSV